MCSCWLDLCVHSTLQAALLNIHARNCLRPGWIQFHRRKFIKPCTRLVLIRFSSQECLRCSADLLDFVGLAFVLSKIPGKSHSKLLTAAVGWASAEIILSKGLILWRARGAEFSWLYTQQSLESNILLVVTLAVTCLLWLFSRHDLNRKLVPLVTFMLLAIAFRTVWLDGTLIMMGVGAWTSLLIKGLVAFFGFGVPTLYLYTSMSQTITM